MQIFILFEIYLNSCFFYSTVDVILISFFLFIMKQKDSRANFTKKHYFFIYIENAFFQNTPKFKILKNDP